MLRRKSHEWHWTLKSDYRALFLCKLMFRTVDESGYEQVRHQLANSKGVETRVKLSKKGWTTGGGRRMPREFYPLQTIDAMEPDKLDSSVLLCKFCRPSPLADFVYEIVAYKFDDVKIPQFFHERFDAMKPAPTASITAASVLMATTTPTTVDSRHRPSVANTGTISLLPGRPAFSVVRSLDPDRWGAKDRATPKLFTSRSMEDLLMSTDEPLSPMMKDDGTDSDDELPAGLDDTPAAPHSDDDSPATPPDFAKLSQRRMTEPSARLLDDEMVSVNGWSSAAASTLLARHAQSLRSREIGVTARFPAALDPIKCRPSVMECSSETSRCKRGHCDVACQVDLPPKHREPAAEAKPKAPAVPALDLNDIDPNYEDFCWDFGDETVESTETFNQSIDFGADCYTITPRDVKSSEDEEQSWPVPPPKEFQTANEKFFSESESAQDECQQHVDLSPPGASLGRLSRMSSSSTSSLPLPSPPPNIVGPTVHLATSRLSAGDEAQSDAGYAASVPDSPKDSTCGIEVEQHRHEHSLESEEQQEEEIDDDADSGSYSTSL